MDVISQLQEQVNTVASVAFNTFGSLQRDAPSVRLRELPRTAPDRRRGGRVQLRRAAQADECCSCQSRQAGLPLPEGGEEAQLKRIADLQAENDAVGQELQKQLEAVEKELKLVQELFSQATDNCFNLKKPD